MTAAGEFSDTNVQEDGVDEPDIVKTDGEYFFVALNGALTIFDADPQDETHEVSRTPIEGDISGMFLWNDLAVVFSMMGIDDLPDGFFPEMPYSALASTIIKVTVVDHTEKTAPTLVRELYFEGWLPGIRRIAESVRLATNVSKRGPMNLSLYVNENSYESEEAFLEALDNLFWGNIDRINTMPLEYWLPLAHDIVYTDEGRVEEEYRLVECNRHYLPERAMGDDPLSIVTINLEHPQERVDDVAVISTAQVLYASGRSMILTGRIDESDIWDIPEDESQIFRFDTESDPDGVTFAAAGAVPGRALNQFSLSEYEEDLRIATTEGPAWNSSNNFFVLRQSGTQFNIVGEIRSIAPGEEIYAARFMGDRGFLVTFPTSWGEDPLFTIDVSDPQNPFIVGELEVPGFSTYLHKFDDNHLIAIGQGGDEWGADGGIALSLYDISDFADPVREHFADLGDWNVGSDAETEHHAFLFYKPDDLLAIPLTQWHAEHDQGVYAFHLTLEDGFEKLAEIDHSGFGETWLNRALRSVVIGDYLFTLSACGLVVTDRTDWRPSVSITLPCS
ncbi:MAG: beta-propeller domain-containing protein [Deltaproteobacteria bacterium]|nr:beta-propeller domain-containing protein [Deltaproteobacteria bacterium]